MIDFESRFNKAVALYTREFVVDDENREVIDLMKKYFQNDPEFECAGFSLQKGIMLMGNFGSGKTILFKVFQKVMNGGFLMKLCSDVALDYSIGGHENLLRYADPEKRCFDDLGMESQQKYYGQEENTMALVIARRYERFRAQGTITHFTTNLTKDQIKEYYGERVYSRLLEMCNFIKLGASASSTDRRETTKPPVRKVEAPETVIELTPEQIAKRRAENYQGLIDYVMENDSLPHVWGWVDVYMHMHTEGLIKLTNEEKLKWAEVLRSKMQKKIDLSKEADYLGWKTANKELHDKVSFMETCRIEFVKEHFQKMIDK